MVNTEKFIERLKNILDYYELTAASFADKIDIQRSSISHLLSGRNKPSLDFVMKVVKNFEEVDLYWLLNGKGKFPNVTESIPPTLFQNKANDKAVENTTGLKEIEKIVVFYKNGTFKSYLP